jgi:hypothetical protein
MLACGNANPWSFLASLDGAREIDCEILNETRAEELDLVNHMVLAAKTSILYAASGNGKTSLLNAGVIPSFTKLGYAVFRTRPRPPWSIDDPVNAFEECMIRENWLPVTPERAPLPIEAAIEELDSLAAKDTSELRALVTQLQAQLLRLSQSPDERSADLKAFLRAKAGSGSLVKFVDAAQAFLGSQTKILIICDQFEELFVHYWGTEKMDNFVTQIGQICKSDVKVQFLFSMREDWVGSMIEFRTAIADIFSAYYKLAPMRRDHARPALQLPLTACGYQMSDSVADLILRDLARCFSSVVADDTPDGRRRERQVAYIELPALQIVAEALWTTRDLITPPFTETHYNLLKEWEESKRSQPSHEESER